MARKLLGSLIWHHDPPPPTDTEWVGERQCFYIGLKLQQYWLNYFFDTKINISKISEMATNWPDHFFFETMTPSPHIAWWSSDQTDLTSYQKTFFSQTPRGQFSLLSIQLQIFPSQRSRFWRQWHQRFCMVSITYIYTQQRSKPFKNFNLT